jgi:hypothetical protein
MGKFGLKYARPRATITGTIVGVAASAAFFAGLVEARRIGRTRAHFRQESAIYCGLENLERKKWSAFVSVARFERRAAAREKLSIERLVAQAGDGRRRYDNDRLEKMLLSYEACLASERQSLSYAHSALVKAERFSRLKRIYADAANCRWLPFTTGPRIPENPLVSGENPVEDAGAPSEDGIGPEERSKLLDGSQVRGALGAEGDRAEMQGVT